MTLTPKQVAGLYLTMTREAPEPQKMEALGELLQMMYDHGHMEGRTSVRMESCTHCGEPKK